MMPCAINSRVHVVRLLDPVSRQLQYCLSQVCVCVCVCVCARTCVFVHMCAQLQARPPCGWKCAFVLSSICALLRHALREPGSVRLHALLEPRPADDHATSACTAPAAL